MVYYCFSHITVHGSSQIRSSPVWIWHFHSRSVPKWGIHRIPARYESTHSPRNGIFFDQTMFFLNISWFPWWWTQNFSLVGGLEHFLFYFSISLCWEYHPPNWRTHIFQRGRLNHQPAADCISKSGPIPSPDSNHGFYPVAWPKNWDPFGAIYVGKLHSEWFNMV